ncbi:MAG: isoprenyl transferase [Candidatus Coatesbacteria bacterium]|nr:isoprenyl transferase [Candidatus Coatesbacteria bacterium]
MVDDSKLPQHIAIIMDGNGRWAKRRGLLRIAGHSRGIDSVRAVVTECARLKIGYLTLYAFSYENWQRPADEIEALMHLLTEYLIEEKQELLDNGIALGSIGDISRLPEHSQNALGDVAEMTRDMTGMKLNLALNYSGRQEILRAVQKITRVCSEGALDPSGIDESTFGAFLDTYGQPDPDLLIRTSGEMRVSNFLLWQIAYTEIYVTDVLWPDFREEELHRAIADYQKRTRKFGKVL